MKRVVLVNMHRVPHYRVDVYNHLARRLKEEGYILTVLSEGLPEEGDVVPLFGTVLLGKLSARSVLPAINRLDPQVVIFWTNPRFYVLAAMLLAKVTDRKLIHWGHRRNFQAENWSPMVLVYYLEHSLDDAIILYTPKTLEDLPARFRRKAFVANNTLAFPENNIEAVNRDEVKRRFRIDTSKNVVFLGRMQKRKRIHDLVAAFRMLGLSDVGLVLAGPDDEGLLDAVSGEGIYKVGPVYGADRLQLLASCDVYCLPGAMGLSIVDAFHCGLPVVTENVKHGPEIMYLKDSENGFIVEVGNIEALASRLRLLLTNDQLRGEFAVRAREVISGDGSIDRMCEGFVQALHYVCAE